MKASQLLKGKRAVKRIPLPLSRDPDAPEQAQIIVGLKAFEPGEHLRQAREYAIARGVKDPKDGDDLYEYGKILYTILLGCVDPDDDNSPFFDGGLEQLIAFPGFEKDERILLAEMHEQWRQEVCPMVSEFEDGQFEQALELLAGPGGSTFFLSLRPGMRVSLMRTTASLLLSSLRGKSVSGGKPEKRAETEPESLPSREARIRVKRKRNRGRK